MRARDEFRDWHYLRPLVGSACPASIMVFDTETYPVPDANNSKKEWHHLRLWCAEAFRLEDGVATRVETRSGKEAKDFWQFVLERMDKKRPLWIFSHNIGFDLTVLGFWNDVNDGCWEFRQQEGEYTSGRNKGKPKYWNGIAVLNDPPTIIKCRSIGSKATLVGVDTFNYFRCSLEEIGKSIGCNKGEMPPYDAPDKVWADYCYQDVTVLRKAVTTLIALVSKEKLGKFGFTVSSQAMNAFRAKFMREETPILIHGSRDAINLERASYHGGIVHSWYIGMAAPEKLHLHEMQRIESGKAFVQSPIYCLDVQSFYPSIMNREQFPHKLVKVIHCPSVKQFSEAMESKGIIAHIHLNCKAPGFPVARGGKVYYATGKFSTVLCYPELERALQSNEISSVGSIAVYKVAKLFSYYTHYFYQMRREYEQSGNKAFAYMCKLLLNSLYGRFAMRRYKWDDCRSAVAPLPFGYFWDKPIESDQFRCYRAMCWLPQMQCTSECGDNGCNGKECINPGHCSKNPLEYDNSFPAISSYVTSYGREEILRLAGIAGIENCLYSDTDSLHVTQVGYDRVVRAGGICVGQMGKFGQPKIAQTAEYRGQKDYTLDGIHTVAGITRPNANQTSGGYNQVRFQRLASILEGEQLDSVAVERLVVESGGIKWHGTIGENGRTQLPLLEDW